jgi:SAM-dependent methyltransferase
MPSGTANKYRSAARRRLGRVKRAMLHRMPLAKLQQTPLPAPAPVGADSAWPDSINPVQHQPPLPIPAALTRDKVVESLASISIEASPRGELEGYARQDCDRFLRTVALVPNEPAKLLEIGAGPYFTTTLIQRLRPQVEMTLTNYYGGEPFESHQLIDIDDFDGQTEQHKLPFVNVNIEEHNLPFDDDAFDIVLYCEVLEHMTNDPWRALVELKRVLRPDGLLVLTTPNATRLESIARLLANENLYDPYSGHGPYGRHNREYTQAELLRLLERCGFAPQTVYTADVHHNRAPEFCDLRRLAELLPGRSSTLGQYHFTASRNAGPEAERRPSWLYRSYAPDLVDAEPA